MKHNLFLRRKNFLLTLHILALAVLSIVLMITPGAAISAEQNGFCISHYGVAGCTAQDFGIKELELVSVQQDCTAGSGSATATFDVHVSTVNPTRYDIGMFIALDGQSAATGSHCYHDFLDNITSNPGAVILDGGPWPNLDGDQCGDLDSNMEAIKKNVQLTFKCVDVLDANGNPGQDGKVDINACGSYDNNAGTVCSGVSGAVPGTSSKCGCNWFQTTIDMSPATPAILVEKSVNPTTVMQGGSATFTVTAQNTGNLPLVNVDVTDNDCTLSGPTGDGGTPNVLDTGETWTFTCTVNDLQPLSFTNHVTVTGHTEAGTPVPGSASATVNVQVPAPPVKIVPTMTEWGMIIFIILAGLGSIYYIRRHRKA